MCVLNILLHCMVAVKLIETSDSYWPWNVRMATQNIWVAFYWHIKTPPI